MYNKYIKGKGGVTVDRLPILHIKNLWDLLLALNEDFNRTDRTSLTLHDKTRNTRDFTTEYVYELRITTKGE